MTMTRMPQVGDSVRSVSPYRKVDGYIASVRHTGGLETHTTPGADVVGIVGPIQGRILYVETFKLIRGLDGWSWAPFDARPGVGDIVIGPPDRGFTPEFLLVALEAIRASGDWNCAVRACGPVPGEPPSAWTTGVRLAAVNYAKAVAGLEGWSWRPARWSGVGATVESTEAK